MDYTIVPVSSGHIEGIVRIEKECFRAAWTRENIEGELANENARFLAAVSGTEVIGYIGVHEIAGEAYISNIAVLPQYRRRGVGEALLTNAAQGARERGCVFITLEVRGSNAAAISLYRKNGFEEAGFRKNFYSEPAEDAVIYTKYFRGLV